MFFELDKINSRPKPFQYYTAEELWNNEHTSSMMLQFHLNGDVDVSSRNTKFIDNSVRWIESHFKIDKYSSICDFGCGPGLYAHRLAQHGANVTGIDFSKRSIEYARKNAHKDNLDIEYLNQNYLDFESDKKFDLITMIMCDYCALSPEQRSLLLRKFNKLLYPTGSLLLDVYSLIAFSQREEQSIYCVNLLNGFWSPKKYYGFLNTFKYDEEKVVLDKYTIIEPDNTKYVYNWLQYFSPDMLKIEFAENGFAVSEILSDVAGNKFNPNGNEFAVIGSPIEHND